MFDNPGRKLKIVAQILFWVGSIGSVIVSFYFMSQSNHYLLGGLFVLLSLIFLFVVPLLFYILSLSIIAQGELVENSTIIKDTTRTIKDTIRTSNHSEKQSDDDEETEDDEQTDIYSNNNVSPIREEDLTPIDICDSCSKTSKVHKCKIVDNYGMVMFRNLCDDCINEIGSMKGVKSLVVLPESNDKASFI